MSGAATTRPGTLYVVATPLGNLEDITARALRVLREVDLIAAEDTRHSGKLLRHFGIRTPLISCHEHNEQQRQEALLGRLLTGANIDAIRPIFRSFPFFIAHLVMKSAKKRLSAQWIFACENTAVPRLKM